MDHLVCFLGGNLALGATEGKTLKEAREMGWTIRQQEDLDLAEALTRSCFEMYNITETGIAPEIVRFNTDTTKNEDITIKPNDRYVLVEYADGRHNIQRPETVESLFILWRITGDVKYREWGWTIFHAFEKWGKVGNGGGYTSLDDVTQIPPPKRDSMESFWLVSSTLNILTAGRDIKISLPLVWPRRSFASGQDCLQHRSSSIPCIPNGHAFQDRLGDQRIKLDA
jgi:mannosyl-oligosaccharide alpha-1,2-mannosidase